MSARNFNAARALRVANRGDRGEGYRGSVGVSMCGQMIQLPQLPHAPQPKAPTALPVELNPPNPRLSRVQVRYLEEKMCFEFYRVPGEIKLAAGNTNFVGFAQGKTVQMMRSIAYASLTGNNGDVLAFLQYCERNPNTFYDAPCRFGREATAQERWGNKYSRIVQ